MTTDTPRADTAPIETEALLPCPFCGGKAEVLHGMGGLVGCMNCALARRDAASWNRRADQPARVGVLNEDVLEKAFIAGFMASGEGYNGEHCGADDCSEVASREAREHERILAALLPTEAGAEPVRWQRYNPTHDVWLEVSEDDLDRYRRVGQKLRPLYATPPAAPTDALVDVAKELERWIADNAMPNSKIYGLLDKLSAALRREAPQAVTVEDILQYLREALQHDQGGLDYSEAVGIPISNATELRAEVAFYERGISVIEDRMRALGGRT